VAADQAIAALRDNGFSLDQITLTEASPWGPDVYPATSDMMNPIGKDESGFPIDEMMLGISNPRSLDNQYGTVHELPPVQGLDDNRPVLPGRSPIITVVHTDEAHAPLAADILRQAGGAQVISTI
jgi:hypothetical protein